MTNMYFFAESILMESSCLVGKKIICWGSHEEQNSYFLGDPEDGSEDDQGDDDDEDDEDETDNSDAEGPEEGERRRVR